MKLKKRIILSFFGIVMLPTVLFIVMGVIMVQYQIVSVRYQYGISASASDFMINSTKLFDRMIDQIELELDEKLEEDPAFLTDREEIIRYCEDTASENVNLIVFKGNELYYQTDEIHQYLAEDLQQELAQGIQERDARYIGDKNVLIYEVLHSRFPDGETGTIYAVVSVDQWLPQLKSLVVQVFCSIILILILTASIFAIGIYQSIAKPINVLKDASRKIRDGNLNFHINASDEDELGQLCICFEEMRQRLKETAEEKIQFDEEGKELISNISHDLKTPITAIKGYVEGIMDGVADTPEKLDRYVRTIYNKAVDMDRLIDELTFYSKIDTNRIPYNFNKINVKEYFADCAEDVGMDLESAGIRFQYANYVDEPVQIIADPEQLRRVINNIISNSVKYFDKERCFINMRIRDVGDFIQVEIEDNAKGIEQKNLPFIFDRFYRTDSSRNSSKGGSGIGLSIVRKIIEDHGGKIWATSKEGIGTVMYFVLRKVI